MNGFWLEWLGFLASLIVLISLLMSSIIKLRWINLLGSVVFATYGFMIGSLPVGVMNICTCAINIYYLIKIYRTEEYFKILPFEGMSTYFKYFIDFYKIETEIDANSELFDVDNSNVSFYILRNMMPAGVFITSKLDEKTLKIELDFVIPEYRDFKIGKFVFENSKGIFLRKGYTRFVCYSSNDAHIDYLKKMGFKEETENGSKYFSKSIVTIAS